MSQFDFNQSFGNDAKEVIDLLTCLGGEQVDDARLVGGVVRDQFYWKFHDMNDSEKVVSHNLSPNKDIDIAVAAKPREIELRLAAAGYPKPFKYIAGYGVFFLKLPRFHYEIAILRSDLTNNGRHAKVDFTPADAKDWLKDSLRRDFTFNAIYADCKGTIFDPHSGMEAIKQRKLSFIGNPALRIEQDYLRVLRYFRYYSAYGSGAIDQAIIDFCQNSAHLLDKIPPARKARELMAMLEMKDAGFRAILTMHKHNILSHILLEYTIGANNNPYDFSLLDKSNAQAGVELASLRLALLLFDQRKKWQEIAVNLKLPDLMQDYLENLDYALDNSNNAISDIAMDALLLRQITKRS